MVCCYWLWSCQTIKALQSFPYLPFCHPLYFAPFSYYSLIHYTVITTTISTLHYSTTLSITIITHAITPPKILIFNNIIITSIPKHCLLLALSSIRVIKPICLYACVSMNISHILGRQK